MKNDDKRKWTKYSKYIRRWINPQPIIIDNLQRWFDRYKVTASKGSQPVGGRMDPVTGSTLFTEDTKNSVQNAYINAEGVIDTLRRDELYQGVQPTLNLKTKLTEWIGSRGVESKLEQSHQAIDHFANTGMGKELADALTLAGIALYNLHIRRRLQMSCMPAFERVKVPTGYQDVPAHTDHSRLNYINHLARTAGIESDVHTGVTKLQADNGEKFLSEYLEQQLT
jgi:hypothetical protein